MKSNIRFLAAFAILFIVASCEKTVTGNEAAFGISGRWNVVVDSIPEGVGPSTHFNVYKGQTGDYYDFRSDSNVYIKEDGKLSVYPYHIDSDSTLTIVKSDEYSDSIPQKYYIDQPSASSLNLATGWFYTPGNIMGRAVYLSR